MTQVEISEGSALDSFSDPTPIEPAGTQVQESEGLDTFGNDEIIELPENKDDDGGKKQEQTEEGEDTKIKRQVDKLEDQEKEDDEEDDKGAKDKKPGEEGDDKPDEKAAEDKKEDDGAKPKGKTIRLKNGDESVDISPDATIAVKVKGKKEFVSVADLQKNWSGQKAWDEEFATINGQKQELEQEVESFNQSREATKSHFAKIGGMIEDAFSNPEADPMEAMKYLIDLSGRNVLEFEKRMMQHYGQLSTSFNEMSEAEQNLFWTQKENQRLKDNQASRDKEIENRKAQEQRNQDISAVQEKYGISAEEYRAVESELLSLEGIDKEGITPDQISHYAALKPIGAKVQPLVDQFKDELSDDEMSGLITGTVDTLYKVPHMDPIEALKINGRKLGLEIELNDELEEEINEKVSKAENKALEQKTQTPTSRGYESFDDYDDEIYG